MARPILADPTAGQRLALQQPQSHWSADRLSARVCIFRRRRRGQTVRAPMFGKKPAYNLRRPVVRMIVQHQQFPIRVILRKQRSDARRDVPFFIACRNHDRNEWPLSRWTRGAQSAKHNEIGNHRKRAKPEDKNNQPMQGEQGTGHAATAYAVSPHRQTIYVIAA